jgi:hypothetical protein
MRFPTREPTRLDLNAAAISRQREKGENNFDKNARFHRFRRFSAAFAAVPRNRQEK